MQGVAGLPATGCSGTAYKGQYRKDNEVGNRARNLNRAIDYDNPRQLRVAHASQLGHRNR